jgi:hypothetical protein
VSDDGAAARNPVPVWSAFGWVLVALTLATAAARAAQLLQIRRDLGLARQMTSGYTEGDAVRLIDLIQRAQLIGTIAAVLTLCCTVGFIAWLLSARSRVVADGLPAKVLSRHWSYVAWRVGIAATFVVFLMTRMTMDLGFITEARPIEIVVDTQQKLVYVAAIQLFCDVVLVAVLLSMLRRVPRLLSPGQGSDPVTTPGRGPVTAPVRLGSAWDSAEWGDPWASPHWDNPWDREPRGADPWGPTRPVAEQDR